jgi:hypothetical protein
MRIFLLRTDPIRKILELFFVWTRNRCAISQIHDISLIRTEFWRSAYREETFPSGLVGDLARRTAKSMDVQRSANRRALKKRWRLRLKSQLIIAPPLRRQGKSALPKHMLLKVSWSRSMPRIWCRASWMVPCRCKRHTGKPPLAKKRRKPLPCLPRKSYGIAGLMSITDGHGAKCGLVDDCPKSIW